MVLLVSEVRHPPGFIDPRIPDNCRIAAGFIDMDYPVETGVYDPGTAAGMENPVDLPVNFQRTVLNIFFIDDCVKITQSVKIFDDIEPDCEVLV